MDEFIIKQKYIKKKKDVVYIGDVPVLIDDTVTGDKSVMICNSVDEEKEAKADLIRKYGSDL